MIRLYAELVLAHASGAFENVGDGVSWPLLAGKNFLKTTRATHQSKRAFPYSHENLTYQILVLVSRVQGPSLQKTIAPGTHGSLIYKTLRRALPAREIPTLAQNARKGWGTRFSLLGSFLCFPYLGQAFPIFDVLVWFLAAILGVKLDAFRIFENVHADAFVPEHLFIA